MVSSGSEVPNPETVVPMTACGTLNAYAMSLATLTKWWAANRASNNPEVTMNP